MGIIQKLIDKAKGILDAPPPTATHVVETNTFDRWDIDNVRSNTKMLDGITNHLATNVDGGRELADDLLAAMFKSEPKFRDATEMRASHRANRQILEEILSTPAVQELHDLAAGDPVNAAIAVATLHDPIMRTAEAVHKAIAEHQTEAEKREREMQAAADAVERLTNTVQNATSPAEQQMATHGLQAALDQFARTQVAMAAQAEAQAQAAAKAAQQGSQQAQSAAKQASQGIEQGQQLAAAFGTDAGALQRMSAQERIDLAKKLKNNRLAEFMKLIGQFKAVQKAESRKRITNAATEIAGVHFSDELERLTVSEYNNFASEELETLFWVRYLEQQLLTYEVKGREKTGQGPVVCVVDESGSMGARDVLGGTREAWSKALALAMLEQARGRKRDFVYIGFGSPGQTHMVEFPYGESTLDKVLEMTEHFFAGGTYYEGPLNDALDYIQDHYERDTRNQGKPDIIFISDDSYTSEFPADFMKRYESLKTRIQIKVYGIALGCTAGGAMQSLCDDVREINQVVSDPKNVGDLFRMV